MKPETVMEPRKPAAVSPARPVLAIHDGIHVVRDDLCPGGTKARFFPAMFDGVEELVYASPAEGGAQTALAQVAKDLGKYATIFVAKRARPHPRSLMAKALGARVYQVEPGYLSVVQARAAAYCQASGATLVPFGVDTPEVVSAIAAAAVSADLPPLWGEDEVWCAAGSGVLARGLAKAFPRSQRHAVQVGRALTSEEVGGATIHVYPYPFGRPCKRIPPFPSDPHYDAKVWTTIKAFHGVAADKPVQPGSKLIVMWNVTGRALATSETPGTVRSTTEERNEPPEE